MSRICITYIKLKYYMPHYLMYTFYAATAVFQGLGKYEKIHISSVVLQIYGGRSKYFFPCPRTDHSPFSCPMHTPANLRPQNNYCREMFYEWTQKLSWLLTLCYAKQCNMGNFYSPWLRVTHSFSFGFSPDISSTLPRQGE